MGRIEVGMVIAAQLVAGGVVLMAPSSLAADLNADLNTQLFIRQYNGTQGNLRLEADRLFRQGEQQDRAGFYDKAIDSYLQALNLYRSIQEVEAQGLTYDSLGKVYAQVGKFTEAEDALRRRLAIARDLKDFQGQVFGFNNLGTLLLQRASILEAQKTFADGLKIAKDTKFYAGEGLSLSNLGLAAYSLGNYNQAIALYEQARILRGQAGDPGEANTLNSLGDAYRAVRDYRSALVSYRQALFVSQNSVDRPTQFRALNGLTQAFYGLGQNSNAFTTLDQRLSLAVEQKDARQLILTLKDLAKFSSAKGDYTAADNYYQRAFGVAQAINDSKEQEGLLREIGVLRSRKYSQH